MLFWDETEVLSFFEVIPEEVDLLYKVYTVVKGGIKLCLRVNPYDADVYISLTNLSNDGILFDMRINRCQSIKLGSTPTSEYLAVAPGLVEQSSLHDPIPEITHGALIWVKPTLRVTMG